MKNNTEKAGQLAAKSEYFMLHQIKLYPVNTRFGSIMWHVSDAGITCELTGLPEIIGQFDDEGEAREFVQKTIELYENGFFAGFFDDE